MVHPMSQRRVYRSTEIVLGPSATVDDAKRAIVEQARDQGHEPLPDCAYAEEIMPPLTGEVVRHKGERIKLTADEFRRRQNSIVFRWSHSLHDEVVGTRWQGYVQVR